MSETSKRTQVGKRMAYTGLGVNFCLFTLKLVVSLYSYSLTVIGDALNNLADFFTSLLTLFSFHMSEKPADHKHPFGHARTEYIASMVIALFIVFVGVQLSWSGIKQFFVLADSSTYKPWTLFVLVISVIVKFSLYFYQRYQAQKINSLLVTAAAKDSLADAYTGLGLVITAVLAYLNHWHIDALIGIIVGLLIVYNGYQLLVVTCDNLLGHRAPKELRQKISDFVLEQTGVLGVHDLVIHDYGPETCFASIHVEVDARQDMLITHELIDQIERKIFNIHNIHLLIHMDPMVINDEESDYWRKVIVTLCQRIDEKIFVHDFRKQNRLDNLILIFDLAVPDRCQLSNQELREFICTELSNYNENIKAYITIDRNYVADLDMTVSDE